jgi:hypothetical protein
MPSGTTTTQSTNDPWKPAQNSLKMGLNAANKAFKGGFGANTGSMVVPYAKQSMDAFGNLEGIAGANSGGQGMSGQAQNIINNGGFNNQQMGALNNWQNTANSNYDFNANPGSQDVLNSILRDTKDSVNLNAAAAGRYGSGIHQGRMAQDIGDQSSQFRMNDYNTFLGRKDAANSNLFNGANAGLANMQSAYGALQAPEQTRLGVGSAFEDLKRRQLDDRERISNIPWDQIGKLMNVGNLGGQYKTTTTQGPGPNPFLQALGGVGTAGNILFGSSPGGLLG